MAKPIGDLITILRNVTGRIDSSDPLFTDAIMTQYLSDFTNLLATQEVRLFKNYTWWEFAISDVSPEPYPVDLQVLGYSTIGPPAYVDGFVLFWYQSPAEFFSIWPETQTYQPNTAYDVKIQAYNVEILANDELNQDYVFRYLCYGAALDIFSDYGEMDKWREIKPVFDRYRGLVYARTNQQYMNQRTAPDC